MEEVGGRRGGKEGGRGRENEGGMREDWRRGGEEDRDV